MKAQVLIATLQEFIESHGDRDVYISTDSRRHHLESRFSIGRECDCRRRHSIYTAT